MVSQPFPVDRDDYLEVHPAAGSELPNTYGALTVSFLEDAFGMFLMKQFFESFPTEIKEAARVDGANGWRIFSHIVVPNAIPVITALTTFTLSSGGTLFRDRPPPP